MLLMAEKGIREGICYVIHRYSKANKKYIKCLDKNEDWLYLMYLDASNLHNWEMSHKLPAYGFKWKKIFQNLIKNL